MSTAGDAADTPALHPERYYSPAAAARLSGLPEPTIRRWLAEGLPHLPTGPRGSGMGVRIKGAWLAEWAEARKSRAAGATPEPEQPKASAKAPARRRAGSEWRGLT